MNRFGLHLPVGKGFKDTTKRIVETPCDTVQIFSGNPMGWRLTDFDPEEARKFALFLKEKGIRPLFLHVPYLVNLASPDPEIHAKSIITTRNALEKARQLGGGYVVTHMGNHKGAGIEEGMKRIEKAIAQIMADAPGGVSLVFEGGAGAGTIMGATIPEIARVMNYLAKHCHGLGVCLDTAHLWAAGYDLATLGGIDKTFSFTDRTIGCASLKLIHANDTDMPLGSNRDHHLIPGEGLIGLAGFKVIFNHPTLQGVPFIIEAPIETIEQGKEALERVRALVE